MPPIKIISHIIRIAYLPPPPSLPFDPPASVKRERRPDCKKGKLISFVDAARMTLNTYVFGECNLFLRYFLPNLSLYQITYVKRNWMMGRCFLFPEFKVRRNMYIFLMKQPFWGLKGFISKRTIFWKVNWYLMVHLGFYSSIFFFFKL